MMNDKDVKEIKRGLAYFSLATAGVLYYIVIGRYSEGLYSICGSLLFACGLILYLAAAIAFFPTPDDDDSRS